MKGEKEATMNGKQVDIYVNVHKGIRNLITRVLFQTGSTDWTDASAVAKLQPEWEKVLELIRSHHEHEDRFIHPLLGRISPGGHRIYEAEHQAQLNVLADLEAHFARVAGDDVPKEKRVVIGLEFYRGLNVFYADFLLHLHREEVEAERALHSLCLPEELMATMGELLGSIPPEEMMLYLDFMIPAMNLPECAELLEGMKASAPPEAFKALADRARKARGESDWQKLEALLER
jgi:hypothetical protein